jgi:hypothetical protein
MKKFELGSVVSTWGFSNVFGPEVARKLVSRHVSGDWGQIPKEDARLNDEAVKSKGMIQSSYVVGDRKVWVITDYGHQYTTVLFPEEY